MELKQYKNEYGHERVDCPFCDYAAYVREARTISQEPARGLYSHIANQAKKEALAMALEEITATEAQHLTFYKENTVAMVLRVARKRGFKPNSITVTKP